jgi:crotonobetainyl-CoA:carnitine CoA-transferase CaiB-like acyl-CoA transferase
MGRPLEGARIIDLSRLLPGPYATLLLSDLGAEIVKVEDPRGGDYLRYMPPLLADGTGAQYHALNRGKKHVVLDLRDDGDKARFLDLVKTADALVESFRPGVLERLGLGPAALQEANPGLTVCRISGFGQEGPDKHRAGHDLNYIARAGLLAMTGEPKLPPTQIADLVGGAWPAALQVTAALAEKARVGEGYRGRVIDVSMTEGARATLLMPLASQAAGEPVSGGRHVLFGSAPAYDVYPTKDGYLTIGSIEPKFWAGVCDALGLEDHAGDAFSGGEDGEAVRAAIRAKLAEKTTAEWTEALQERDICVEAVAEPSLGSTVTLSLEEGVVLPATSLDVEPRPEPAGAAGADNALLG